MQNWIDWLKRKTFKREVSVLLIGLLGFTVFAQDVEMAKAIVWPIMTFAGLAFGLDWNGKQNTNSADADDEPSELQRPVGTFKSNRWTTGQYQRPTRPEQPTNSWSDK